jgi:hypothetical protein
VSIWPAAAIPDFTAVHLSISDRGGLHCRSGRIRELAWPVQQRPTCQKQQLSKSTNGAPKAFADNPIIPMRFPGFGGAEHDSNK